MELDLHQIIRILRRRWWILMLLPALVGGLAYYNVSREIPMYQATATMVVNPGAISGQGSTQGSLNEGVALSYTYVQLINTQPVRERVQDILGGPIRSGVSASTVQNTSLIRVTATGADPQAVADTANAYVAGFQSYIADQNAYRLDLAREGVDAQIQFLNTQIQDLDAQISAESDEDEVDRLQAQRQELVRMLAQLETDAAATSMQAASARVIIESVDSARAPFAPISPNVPRTTMLGVFVGLLLAVGVIALLEFLDNTVKGHTNISEITGSPLLASIPVNTSIKRGTRQVFVVADPQSGSAEAMRLLRTNLSFAGVDSPISSIAVTSSVQAEGKSTIAANLAVAVASSGQAVALVDADLRKPTQFEIFGVETHQGVTSFVSDRSFSWEQVSQRVAVPGLVLIPSGPIPPNPAEMIASARFRELLDQLRTEFDLVIVDTPPILQASDGLVAGALTDGLLVVTQHGRTRVDALKGAVDLIRQSGTRLIGVTLNRVDKSSESYYGSYYGSYGQKK